MHGGVRGRRQKPPPTRLMGSDLPQANGGATENTVKSAAIIIAILPFMILYPFLQKYFVKGVNVGAVKG